ncbi:MAG: type I DNA topoisomerase, partial [Deltaproteobacteria bacterium]|nr:type I DNA topoisomerase [Deltaproteobacteria bacterium]
LWDKVRQGLSAGRVQSVALRIVVDREREIEAFKPEEYWSLTAGLEGPSPPPFEARLTKIRAKKAVLKDQAATQAVVDGLAGQTFEVAKITKRRLKPGPPPPFITSTLQQEAFNKLGFPAAKTMSLAQQLYEGIELGPEGAIGLITYMRTDSTRVSPQAQAEARQYIDHKFGSNYLPAKPPFYKSPKRAQEAHEAVRPTSAFRDPERVTKHLAPDQAKLYRLIWRRFVASQMAPAQVDQTTVDISAGNCTFRASGSVIRFDGYRRVSGQEEKNHNGLPDLKEGQELKLLKLIPKQHFTQPPPRFSEASLVKALEEKGIGRPSTYAAILSTLQNKEYARKDKGRFRPTELGLVVTDLLVESFPDLLDETFTAQMEGNLDQVEEGRVGWQETLGRFYMPFSQTLSQAKKSMANLKKQGLPTDLKCPACGSPMVIRLGRNGQFLACSAYPKCKTTSNFSRDESGKIVPQKSPSRDEPSQEVCDKCGSPMVIKTSRTGSRFLACSAYPQCKNAKGLPTGVACPQEGCDGQLVERASRKGKVFYGCSNYPKCKYVVWDRPVAQACPQCGHPHLVRKELKAGPVLACPQKGCGHREPAGE